MTPDERRLIEDLFERLAAQAPSGKDRQAEALIHDLVRQFPDSAYLLVQTLLVYEHQLQEAAERIKALEADRDEQASFNGTGGSFLPGRYGAGKGGRPAAVRSSYEYRNETTSVPRAGGSPAGAQRGPATAPVPRETEPPRAGGGGFFRSAMATAAGVAGGMLAADSLRSLFGGSGAHAADTQQHNADHAAQQNADPHADAAHEEAQTYEASDDDWGEDDFGSDDIEI
ncbi:MAG: DUF2076 domain-containing protein [Hyphomicrobiaceae bacterium]